MALFNIIAIGHLENIQVVDEVRWTEHGYPPRNPLSNLQEKKIENPQMNINDGHQCTDQTLKNSANETGCISVFL